MTITLIKLKKMGLFLIIPFVSVVSHTVVDIPPTLFFFTLSLGICSIYLYLDHRFKKTDIKIIALPVITVIYFILSQPFLQPPFHRLVGVISAILYIIPVVLFSKEINTVFLKKLISWFVNISIILFVIEAVWRYYHPNTHYDMFFNVDSRWIYRYKMGGLMYSDSNGVCIHLIIVLFFIYYLEKRAQKKYLIKKLILLMLIAFTFSRAGWLAALVGIGYMEFFKGKNFLRYLISVSITGAVLWFTLNVLVIKNDNSFQSKIDIAYLIIDYFKNASLGSILFGIGFFNSYEILGRYPHNFWMVYTIESGIIGLGLVSFMFISFIIYTKKKVWYILFPFFIASLSATLTFVPYLYVVVGIVYVLEQKSDYNNLLHLNANRLERNPDR